MTPNTFIGIDPGKAGGIAVVSSVFTDIAPMPGTERDLLNLLLSIRKDHPEVVECRPFAFLEFVSSSPQMGVKSAFTFGQGWGALRMALTCAAIPFETVTPGVWQRGMSCLTKGDKNVTKRRAQELFPGLKITHKTADALLIAEWCRRKKGGAA